MAKEANISERVSKYLRRQMSEVELKDFESALEQNKELREELAFQKSLDEAIAINRGIELKQEFVAIEQSLTEPPDIQSSNNTSGLFVKAITALIILALVIASYLYFSSSISTQDNNQLYADNFSPYPNTLMAVERGEVSNDESEITKIMQAYDAKKYPEVIALIDKASVAEQGTMQFYKAISLMQEADYSAAAKIFDELKTKSLKDYQSAIFWYGALAHLQLEHTDRSIVNLEELINSTDRYQRTKAEKLLEQLR